MKYVTSTFRLPEEIYERIRIEAFKRRVSIAEIMRDACEVYFENMGCPECFENRELKVQGDDSGPNSENNCR